MGNIDTIIDGILKAEGGYSDNESDSGGKTNYGVTELVAKQNGYAGDMKNLPVALARQIYLTRYWTEPHFDKIAVLSEDVAAELCDIGVNAGLGFAKPLIQSALNLLNRQGKDYADIPEDGAIGAGTLAALAAYLSKRGKEGEMVLVRMLNIMKGAHYIAITKANPTQECFLYGWLLNRTK